MLYLAIILFILLGSALVLCVHCIFSRNASEIDAEIRLVESGVTKLLGQKEALDFQINAVNLGLTKTVKMYETARDICTSLDEEKLLTSFREDLKKNTDYEKCILVAQEKFDPAQYPHSAIFPLLVKETHFGYLVVQGVELSANPHLSILAGHFALGLKRARLYKMIQELAITDGVTGLYTRRYAMERFKEEFLRSQAHHFSLSVLMIDVDDFKDCNDKYGHLVGDIVLFEIGNRIKENIREVDMLARFGGEEFIVFAPNTSKESVFAFAERIRKGIEEAMIRAYDERLKTTVSIGLSSYPEDAKSPEDLIGKADWALYQAKKLGKNRSCAFGAFHE
jgi:diguanylate cyclase (GGDEF)-like protein